MSKESIFNRDNGLCFYCGRKLLLSEATQEHLLATSHGGGNSDANMTIACAQHNHEAGNLSIVDKIKIRDRFMRASNPQPSSIQAAVRILKTTLQSDCSNELADKLTTIAIDMLEEQTT